MNNNEYSRPIDGILKNNPIFIKMIALTPALLVTKTFIGAVVFSFVLFCVLVLTSLVTYPIIGKLKGIAYRAVYMLIASGFTAVADIVFSRTLAVLYDDVGVYLPYIVVAVTIISLSTEHRSFVGSIAESACSGLGYGLAISVIAFIRELLSTGMIFTIGRWEGFEIFGDWFTPVKILAVPAGAMILIGVIIAVARKITDAYAEAEARREEEFELILRGEHESLVFDEELGVVVLRSTVMRIERDRIAEEEQEMIDLTMLDDEFEFEAPTDEDVIEDNDEDVIFEDYDYE